MAVDAKGNLLVAECGETTKLVRLTPGEAGKVTAKTVFAKKMVGYIWAIRTGADGTIYLATGPRGQVWKLPADESDPVVLLETGAKNVISLAVDAKGNVFAGTDAGTGRSMVLKVDGTGKAFVLLDAGEVDVTALATDAAGNVYAATATPEDGPMGGGELDSGIPSKPGKVEPEITDPDAPAGDMDVAPKPAPHDKTGTKKSPVKPGHVRMDMPGEGLYAQMPPGMPVELKALMEKMKLSQTASKKGPSTGKKSALSMGKAKKGQHGAGSMGMHSEMEPEEGNAVYRIGTDGSVRTLFRTPDMLLSLLVRDGELLVGSGPEGKLISFDQATQAQSLIARVGNENIMSLFSAADGTVYCGTSNSGQVYTLSSQTAAKGSYTSAVLDAGHTATWGRAAFLATIPEGARATIALRTGNVKDVQRQEKFWSDWSNAIEPGDGSMIDRPSARFLQYRVSLESAGQNKQPVVQQVGVSYQVENLPPKLKNLTAEADTSVQDGSGKEEDTGPHHTINVTWDASDPNHDTLAYRVLYREVGTELWIQLAKDLKETSYDWNTRAVPDGKYQIKVIASDAPDNTAQEAKSVAQVTPPFLVVNTPPTINDVKTTLEDAKATITGTIKGKLSPIVEVRFQIDSQVDWQLAAASDKIFDSPSEGFTLTTKALSASSHRITVRATDAQGNSSYQAVTVNVK